MKKELPQIIKEVGFAFDWDERKVWALDLPTETMPIEQLSWHMQVPFIWSKPDGYYDVTPQAVLDNPDAHPEEYARTMAADTSYPIDVMFHKEHWVILDGLHRLMRLMQEGRHMAQVRKVPESAIPLIAR